MTNKAANPKTKCRVRSIALMAVLLTGLPEFSLIAQAQNTQPALPATLNVSPLPNAIAAANPASQPPVNPSASNSAAANGQDSTAAPPLSETVLIATAEAKAHVRDASVLPESMTTIFFTAWQHALLQEAKIGFFTRLPDGSPGAATGPDGKKDPGIREISLGGIAFANTSQWTVWLNGVRVTPNALPQQILDIKVTQSYIDLKWFDNYTNKIYPIRLRPQERFNLDTRIFLPGTSNPDSTL